MAQIIGDDLLDDTLDGTPEADLIEGRGGNDVVNGFGEVDELRGQAGDDTLNGGDGNDGLDGGDGTDGLSGDAGDDYLFGGAGSDTLIGGDGIDTLSGLGGAMIATITFRFLPGANISTPVKIFGAGMFIDDGAADTLTGGAGDDTLQIGLGDLADGGDGFDQAFVYLNALTGPVSIDLNSATAAADIAAIIGGTVSNIEAFDIFGTEQGDTLIGALGAYGGLIGAGGDDTIVGGNQGGYFVGGDGVDSVTGGAGIDTLYANIGVTGVLLSAQEDDGDVDQLFGLDGNDTVYVGLGDTADGGAGNDMIYVTFDSYGSGLNLDLSTATAALAALEGASGGTYTNFERFSLYGTDFDDVILGGPNVANIRAGGGNDIITFGDRPNGTLGAGGDGDDTITGGAFADTLYGGGGSNILSGGGGGDRIFLGIDGISGESPQAGVNSVNGGDGYDFAYVSSGFTTAQTADTFVTTLTNVEEFEAFTGRNVVTADGASSWIRTAGYNDVIQAGAGFDRVEGNGGDDNIDGGSEDDYLDGGAGFDTVSYLSATSSVTVVLGIVGPQNTGAGGFDELYNFEGIQGGNLSDRLEGDAGDNVIFGMGGFDTIYGGEGVDTLYAGDGGGNLWHAANQTVGLATDDLDADTLIGGSGRDVVYVGLSDYADGAGGTDRVFVSLIALGGPISLDLTGTDPLGVIAALTGGTYYSFEEIGVFGTAFADTINGTANSDRLFDLAPADGDGGGDTFYGHGGDDFLSGGSGANYMDGGDGNDTFYNTSFQEETFVGGAGNDFFLFGSTAPVDIIGNGHDTIDGGDGIDRISFQRLSAGITLDLSVTASQNNGFSTITLSSVEEVIGGAGADAISGDAANNLLFGGLGNDMLAGGAGADVLLGAEGDDVIAAGDGSDYVDGGVGNDIVYLNQGGVKTLIGGDGLDLIGFQNEAGGQYVDLAAGVHAAGGNWDAFSGFEGVIGGDGGDQLFGDDFDNVVYGGDGSDTLVGRAGADTVVGGDGDDWIVGGAGDDLLEGGAGINVLIGDDGLDLASYDSAASGVWVNMAAGVYSATGVWDVFYVSIEGALGSAYNDNLFGSSAGDTLRGGGGDDALIGLDGDDTLEGGDGFDWIVGGAGNDTLIGGAGVDVLTGGAGADVFDLGTAAGWDVAFDFDVAEDRFDLGGLSWLGFLEFDADGDGSLDTLLGYDGGNFVALGVSGLTLDQWNALVG